MSWRIARPASVDVLALPVEARVGSPLAAASAAGAWGRFWERRSARGGFLVLVLIALASVVGPHLGPRPYWWQQLNAANLSPSRLHWFGTDDLGRDVFTRVWIGGRVSLGIALAAVALDVLWGATYGCLAGYVGGWLDTALMRVVDVLYGVPSILVVMLLPLVLRPGVPAIIIALALTSWLGMARLVRAQVLQLREQEYVLAARALGAGQGRVLLRHILPGLAGPALVWLSWTIPAAIFFEALLSFVGLGVQPPLCSWGSMAADAVATFRLHPYQFAFPAAAISLTILACHVVADGLAAALAARPESQG